MLRGVTSSKQPPNKKKIIINAYRTFVRLFSSMTSHVHQKHVLCFKRLLFSHAPLPTTDKLLAAVLVDVIAVHVLNELLEMLALLVAVSPAAHVIVRLFHTRVAVVDTFGFLGIGRLAPIWLRVHFGLVLCDGGIVYNIGRYSFVI